MTICYPDAQEIIFLTISQDDDQGEDFVSEISIQVLVKEQITPRECLGVVKRS
jgi:hypothetical protein